jgi:DNA replication protein DnaC
MTVAVRIPPDQGVEQHTIWNNIEHGTALLTDGCPAKYATATVSVPAVDTWVDCLVSRALAEMRFGHPVIRRGPWLVLAGKTGRGKTWEAWAAIRALSLSGVRCTWKVVTAADMFVSLRPRAGVDSEEVMAGLTFTGVLVIDDLGLGKDSEWCRQELDRLVLARCAFERPTIFTTNVPVEAPPGQPCFGTVFGDRIVSRMAEMATVVPFTGPDRRRSAL